MLWSVERALSRPPHFCWLVDLEQVLPSLKLCSHLKSGAHPYNTSTAGWRRSKAVNACGWTAAYGAALSLHRWKILCFVLLRVPVDHHFTMVERSVYFPGQGARSHPAGNTVTLEVEPTQNKILSTPCPSPSLSGKPSQRLSDSHGVLWTTIDLSRQFLHPWCLWHGWAQGHITCSRALPGTAEDQPHPLGGFGLCCRPPDSLDSPSRQASKPSHMLGLPVDP